MLWSHRRKLVYSSGLPTDGRTLEEMGVFHGATILVTVPDKFAAAGNYLPQGTGVVDDEITDVQMELALPNPSGNQREYTKAEKKAARGGAWDYMNKKAPTAIPVVKRTPDPPEHPTSERHMPRDYELRIRHTLHRIFPRGFLRRRVHAHETDMIASTLVALVKAPADGYKDTMSRVEPTGEDACDCISAHCTGKTHSVAMHSNAKCHSCEYFAYEQHTIGECNKVRQRLRQLPLDLSRARADLRINIEKFLQARQSEGQVFNNTMLECFETNEQLLFALQVGKG